jgi:hypothetical protein
MIDDRSQDLPLASQPRNLRDGFTSRPGQRALRIVRR